MKNSFKVIIAALLGLSICLSADAAKKQRTIQGVQEVNVDCQVGCAPTLPYLVWVTYSDGHQDWRQVRWTNSARAIEELEATYPVGKEYTVDGYVIGDNTTQNGYPIVANVKVVAKKTVNHELKAEPLPLANVKITGSNRLTSNRDLAIDQILSWDVKSMCYNYLDTYGFSTEGYPEGDGWDSPTTKLKGHGTGHYLSALAFAYNSTDDAAKKAALKENVKFMLDCMRKCQEKTFVWNEELGRYWEARDFAPEEELRDMKGTWAAFDVYKQTPEKYGYGYINAIPAQHCALIEMYRAYNNNDWVWAPYYTVHKQLAGLIDIANNIDDKELSAKAYTIAKDMGLWVWNRMHYRTYVKMDGDRAERQSKPGNRYEMWNMYIAGEVGGMCESLSRLAEMSSDPTDKARLIEAANCFDTKALFDPVSVNIDDVRTRHANQHIPMFVGALRSYRTNNNSYYYDLAYNFWHMLQGRYIYAMGGVGNGEMFRQPYSQMLSMNTNVMSDWRTKQMLPNPTLNETCCAYNIAKLTKDLNCYDPDDARYMDYYERVLYNQLVGSVHPEHYGVTYHYAVGMNAIKPFGSETPGSSCCGGTGSENHVKYQEAAYFVGDNTIWVGLYIPSEAKWGDVVLAQDCLWPAEKSTITVKEGNGNFTLKLRVPYWATEGFTVSLNGKVIARDCQPSSYYEISGHNWKAGDKVEVEMPFTKHINFGPDKMALAATGPNEPRTPFDPQWLGTIMYGPLVMATEDVHDWSNADINLSGDLSEIVANAPTQAGGFAGNLYTLTLDGLTFQPDYYETHNATHYLRLNVASDAKKAKKGKLDKSELATVVALAKERVAEQEAWNSLAVKVPAFSPWAPNGYDRMLDQMAEAEKILAEKKPSMDRVNDAVSALNVCINTMRPGNLAEPEDLEELLTLVTDSKEISSKTTELREAIDFADMVVSYVNDGSGTADMIVKATARLKEARANLGK